MARITVEDCLERVPNRFELVLLAARRAKQLLKGARPLVDSDNKDIVTALREVADSLPYSHHVTYSVYVQCAVHVRCALHVGYIAYAQRPQ